MHIETTNAACPLCKRLVDISPDRASESSRLCDECRSMVQTILPKTNSGANVMRPQYAATYAPQVDVGDFLYQDNFEPDVANNLNPRYVTHELEAQNDTESGFDDGGVSFEDQIEITSYPDIWESDYQAHEQAQEGDEITKLDTQPLPEQTGEDLPYEAPITPPQTGVAYESTSAQKEIAGSLEGYDPALDFTLNEWPLLVKDERGGQKSKLLLPFAILLIISCGAAAYFFVYQRHIGNRDSARNQSTATGPRARAVETASLIPQAEAAKDTKPVATPAEQQEQPPAANDNPAQAPAETTASSESDIGGKHSLQAASFPNEAGAREFADRLARAGVPAYVVVADISGRGKWFRVRVGRFATPEEAQRFAAQSRQRASAAGINLNLIVCAYEKP